MGKSIKDSYKLYKNSHENPVSISEYVLYSSEYNKFLIDKVLEGYEVTLPNRLGTLSIVGQIQKVSIDENGKVKGLAPDWVKTKKLWDSNPEAKEKKKLLYHTNSGTENTRYKFFWSKRKILIQNKGLYALRMTRCNKRAVHNLIKNGKKYFSKI